MNEKYDPSLSKTEQINLKYLVQLYNLEAERMNKKVLSSFKENKRRRTGSHGAASLTTGSPDSPGSRAAATSGAQRMSSKEASDIKEVTSFHRKSIQLAQHLLIVSEENEALKDKLRRNRGPRHESNDKTNHYDEMYQQY